MPKKQFKAESKRLLDLMINSIYTHREIFLRELISNASDACDKLLYKSLTENLGLNRGDFRIELSRDSEKRTLTVSDNGIGMDREELENNLGVIASSGTLKFRKEVGDEPLDTDVIGQFGVGFYSAFMVASEISVLTKKYGMEEAWLWTSSGADGYTISEAQKEEAGTVITLKLKENTEDESYSDYLDEWKLRELVKKYSDYIRFPIMMEVTKSRKKEGSDPEKPEWESYTEIETLNSMEPIWQRARQNVTDAEYAKFYEDKFRDFDAPQRIIHVSAEGAVQYKALMFIPSKAPFDYYTRNYERGLQLYSGGVLIMDKCADLLPEFFQFVRGVVDSPDLSLNISRELLQHDRQLKLIEKNLEKKIKADLIKLLKDDREGYEKFWKNFGRQIKYGCAEGYGVNRELLSDLVMFYSSTRKKPVTLEEYVAGMKEDQKYIYYAVCESPEKADRLPQTETLRESGTEVLYFTEEVDEFVAQILGRFKDKEFRSVLDGEVSEEAEKKASEASDAHKAVFDFVKNVLGDKVREVRASARLKSHPVCLAAGEGLSFEMEKYFKAVQPDAGIKAERILELNCDHPVFAALEKAVSEDEERAKKYAKLLYCQALLIADMPLEDPSEYTDLVCELMV